jgi:hypothetical protein
MQAHKRERSVAQIWARAQQVEDLGQHADPHAVIICSPLNELYLTALPASNWAAGRSQSRGSGPGRSAKYDRGAPSFEEAGA